MERKRGNVLSGLEVDRAALVRRDTEHLEELWRAPETRVVPVWRSKHVVIRAGKEEETPSVAHVSPTRIGSLERAIWLGRDGAGAYFAVDVSEQEDPVGELGLSDGHEIRGLREVAALLPRSSGALLAYANGMVAWHRRHLYCGLCGHETRVGQAGHVRECTSCGETHFPRTDPAVIMLVTHGERCLLGRQASWPAGVHSTLAGFVEPGESLEEAVAREVFEEASVRVTDVRYHSSQPWPFPSSLMLGFTARAETTELELADDELEAAGWYTREELRAGAVKLPSTISIARRLIEDWLDGG